MRTDLSLVDLAKELERRNANKADYVTDTRKLTMEDDTTLSFQNGVRHNLQANDVAHKQIAARLEIPAKYYDRMRASAPAMLAKNVNHWLQGEPETRMIRTLDGKVRAFLSDHYNRIENEDIAKAALPALLNQPGVQIVSSSITETRMYIKAVFTKVQGEVRKGDVVQAGVAISNSEVGLGAVNITPLIYRLVCTNGMILQDSKYQARHVGGRVMETDDIRGMLTDETLKADDTAIMMKVRDVVAASFDEVRFARQLDLMRGATEQKLEGNPAEAVKLLAKKNNLNEFEEGGILRNLIEGADLSRWGLLNAITATAKEEVLSYDRATELETLGGTLLAMPQTDWRLLAKAA
jgi:hypothetical protein